MIRTLLALLCLAPALFADVVDYPWPTEVPKSTKYQVRMIQGGVTKTMTLLHSEPYQTAGPDGTGLAGFLAGRTLSYLPFAFTGQVEVEVTKLFGTAASRVEISPKSYNIEPHFFDGTTVRFFLNNVSDRPEYISVNFVTADNLDANGTGSDIKNGLMLFGDAPETNIPPQTGGGTVVYSPSVTATQLATADLIYFPPGFHDLTLRYPTDPYLGVLPMGKNGQQVYVAGGAVIRGSIHGRGKDNLKIFGRGIITGQAMVWHAVRDELGVKDGFMDFTGSDDCIFEGFTIVNPTHHTLPSSNRNIYRQFKIIGWSYNSDGVRPSADSLFEEIFIKTMDDYDYARDKHTGRNSVIWPMQNGAFGQLGWNNLGSGNTTYQNIRFINAEWASFSRNRGIIGSVLNQGVNLSGNLIENITAENNMCLLANITIEQDINEPFDATKPGLIQNFTFRNIILEKPFLAPNGNLVKNPIRGFTFNGATAMVKDISFINLVVGNTLVTNANASQFFDIDPATTSNITFTTEGTLYTVAATAGTGGTVSPSGNIPTPAGMTRTITAIPNSGKKIKRVLINGSDVGRLQNITFENISANHNVAVEFENGTDYFYKSTVLSIPANLTATPVSPTSITLAWQDTSANEISFEIQRSPDGTSGWATIHSAPANSSTFTNTGLNSVTQYFYRIRSVSSTGSSGWSTTVSATTPVSPPAAPTNFAKGTVTSSLVPLSWTDTASNETGFEIQRAPDGTNDWNTIATPAANANSYNDNSVIPGTPYVYRMRAVNAGGGSAWTATLSASTPQTPPAPPNNLTASASGPNSIALFWSDNSNNESNFLLQRSDDGINNWATVASPAADDTTYLDTTVSPLLTYYYRLRAQNSAGDSAWTVNASATTPQQSTPAVILLGNSANASITSTVSSAQYALDSAGILTNPGVTMTYTGTAPFPAWRFTVNQNLGTSSPGTFSLAFTSFQDVDATTGTGTSPVGGYNSITSNGVGLGIFGGANANFIGNTTGADGEEGMIFGLNATGLSNQFTLLIKAITFNQTGTGNFTGLDSAKIISRLGGNASLVQALGSVATPVQSVTVNVESLALVLTGGSNIPELFTILNGTDGSQVGFRISSISMDIVQTVPLVPATMTLGSLAQTYNGSPRPATATTNPAGLTVGYSYESPTYAASATAPTSAGSYSVTATITSPGYTGASTGTLVIGKASTSVTLANLNQIYDGNSKSATASASPSVQQIALTYDGLPNLPVNAGNHAVVATVVDPNYQGTAAGTLEIEKAPAIITLGTLSATYNGSEKPATSTTTPVGKNVEYTYTAPGYPASSTPPIDAGSYQVDAIINEQNYQGTTSGTLVIAKANAVISVPDISVIHDGSPVYATATTTPANLNVEFTYSGSASPPINVGTYQVVGTIDDRNYQGSASGTLTITPSTSYASWSQENAGGQDPAGDFDKDGVPNGIEYFMGATGSSFTANPAAVNRIVTWPKNPLAQATYQIELSSTLSDQGNPGDWISAPSESIVDDGTSVTLTMPANGGRLFARFRVFIP